MARDNKLSGRKKRTGKPAEEFLRTIIEDVTQTAAMPFDKWAALRPFPALPPAIPLSSGRHLRVTEVGVDAARNLTRQTWLARGDFRQKFTREEFAKLSFTAIGETIQNIPARLPRDAAGPNATLVDDAFYAALRDDYIDNLNQLADQAGSEVDWHIPCHLFHRDQRVPAFSVGPVEFRPPAEWIDRFVTDPEERAQVLQVETAALPVNDLLRQALAPKAPRYLYNAWSVLSSLRGFSWVATIRMAGHAPDQSHRKASIFVGLAIDAIGLRFHVEEARRFTKAGRQHLFGEDRLATAINGAFLHGSSAQMPGLGSKPGALAAKLEAERPFLDAAGRLLEVYVRGRDTSRAPHLIERWANALYWLGEARREASDFMAVVNYGCAADGLSGAGGKAAALTRFAEAALNPRAEPVPAGSLTIADAVGTVYREGRNKLVHGEEPGLLEDLAEARATGDTLLAYLFDAVTLELASVVASRPEILTLNERNAYRCLEGRLKQRL